MKKEEEEKKRRQTNWKREGHRESRSVCVCMWERERELALLGDLSSWGDSHSPTRKSWEQSTQVNCQILIDKYLSQKMGNYVGIKRLVLSENTQEKIAAGSVALRGLINGQCYASFCFLNELFSELNCLLEASFAFLVRVHYTNYYL